VVSGAAEAMKIGGIKIAGWLSGYYKVRLNNSTATGAYRFNQYCFIF
jgi:hypothetical protein